jgi:hypothetical protein
LATSFQRPPRRYSLANCLSAPLSLAIPQERQNSGLQAAHLVGSGAGNALGGKHAVNNLANG